MERELIHGERRTEAAQILVLLHDEDEALPSGTSRWLENRQVECWHHLRWGREADLARLARLLTGRAIGLVLSGGGAKGYAHAGVIRALEEAGIAIDMIGGTSMGSIISAGYAMGLDSHSIVQRNKELLGRYRPFSEYTVPLISIIGGTRLDRLLQDCCADLQVEDLWINYFCISTNLTTAEPRVHRKGPLWKAVRSSIAIPGITPPVIEGDSLLVDGGVLNNLPGDVMKGLCRGKVILVDTTPKREVEVEKGCTRFPAAGEVLWSRINPFARSVKVPGILQIMARTTMLSSIHNLSQVKMSSDYYLNPPVQGFGMLDFGAIDSVVEVGYRYAKEKIAEWAGSLGAASEPRPDRVEGPRVP